MAKQKTKAEQNTPELSLTFSKAHGSGVSAALLTPDEVIAKLLLVDMKRIANTQM